MRTAAILLLAFAAFAVADYDILYTAYTDNTCSKVDSSMTGQIFYDTCAPEYVKAHRTGKITFINSEYLTSCDYSDTACSALILCVNYTNDACADSATAAFSNKYTWSIDENGNAANLIYTAYTAKDCPADKVDTAQTGQLTPLQCAAEFQMPRTGKITYIDDNMLTSCDYLDSTCGTVYICANYSNGACADANGEVSFSNKYSWTKSSSSSGSASGAGATAGNAATGSSASTTGASSATGSSSGGDANAWDMSYTGYTDSVCSEVDESISTDNLVPFSCNPERRYGDAAGIVTVNDNFTLTSCDYSDTLCNVLTECKDYKNGECSDSNSGDFSNKYTWVQNGNSWSIFYTAYTAKGCAAASIDNAMTGQLFDKQCSAEYRKIPQSGKITRVDDNSLTSCDYADTNCQVLIRCEDYNNAQCYGSAITSFSNKYSWKRSGKSSAATTAACLFATVFAVAFAMF